MGDLFDRSIGWLVVPEGNGKTTLIAGLGLYWLECKPLASVLAAASAVDQAKQIYTQAEGMVLRTPSLHELTTSSVLEAKGKRTTMRPRFDCLEGFNRVNHANGARLQIKPASDMTGDGVIPDVCFIDELHRHRTLALYRTWAGKIGKRNGKLVVISTAGEPGHEFELTREEMRHSAADVERDGCFARFASGRWVLHDWSLGERDDPMDFAKVAEANPLESVTEGTLEVKWRETPGMTLAHWTRFTCNLPTRAVDAAVSEVDWARARSDETIPLGAEVWLGLDLAFRDDTTAIVPLWMPSLEQRLLGEAAILVPPRDGNMLKPTLIQEALEGLCDRYEVSLVVMDPSKGEQMAEWIRDELGVPVVERTQSHKMACADFERFMEGLRNGSLRHSGDPGLTQHVMNAVAKQLPGGDTRFWRSSKSRAPTLQDRRVIDALTAAAMVHSARFAELSVPSAPVPRVINLADVEDDQEQVAA